MPSLTVVERLQQLILALDARHVQPGRATEAGIAESASELRAKAVARLAELGAAEGPDPLRQPGFRVPPSHRHAALTAEERHMTTVPPVRPPPSAAAPDDFDAGMIERWAAWNARGRVESAQGRRHLGVALMVIVAASLAAFAIKTLLAR